MATTRVTRLDVTTITTRTGTGAPRTIMVRPGQTATYCPCPTPGQCSHLRAVNAFLADEVQGTVQPRVDYVYSV